MRHLLIAALAVMLALPVAAQDFQKGWEAHERGDYATALREWRPLAEQGLAEAQFNLGNMYSKDHGVPQDYVEAVKWYRKAAEQGFAPAQNNLGIMYYYGKGVPQDYGEAMNWYRKAAEQGHANAQYILGDMYSKGQGVPQDYVKAAMWLDLSARQGKLYATRLRNQAFSEMTPDQIAEAERLAREWLEKKHDKGEVNAPPAQTNGTSMAP